MTTDARIERRSDLGADQIDHWIGGRAGTDLGSRTVVQLTAGEAASWVAAISFEESGGGFSEDLVWAEAGLVLLAAGAEVYVLSIASGSVVRHIRLDGYFASMHLAPDRAELYIAGASELTAIDRLGQVRWTTRSIAIDGVIVNEVTADEIQVLAQMDPPDGWDLVRLERKTGKVFSRTRKPADEGRSTSAGSSVPRTPVEVDDERRKLGVARRT